MQIIQLNCPGCGAPVSTEEKNCKYCKRPIVIASFSSVSSMPPLELNKYAAAYRKTLTENPGNRGINGAIALCYLKLKLYDKAAEAFEKAVEDNFDNSELFFYAAVSLLKGKKAFVAPRADIDKIMEYLNAALMIELRGIYHYFLAYVKYDYFHRKYLNISPGYMEEFVTANSYDTASEEVEQLFSLLGVEKPGWMGT
jgi:tetratricopeptide (TPR) repeat protein